MNGFHTHQRLEEFFTMTRRETNSQSINDSRSNSYQTFAPASQSLPELTRILSELVNLPAPLSMSNLRSVREIVSIIVSRLESSSQSVSFGTKRHIINLFCQIFQISEGFSEIALMSVAGLSLVIIGDKESELKPDQLFLIASLAIKGLSLFPSSSELVDLVTNLIVKYESPFNPEQLSFLVKMLTDFDRITDDQLSIDSTWILLKIYQNNKQALDDVYFGRIIGAMVSKILAKKQPKGRLYVALKDFIWLYVMFSAHSEEVNEIESSEAFYALEKCLKPFGTDFVFSLIFFSLCNSNHRHVQNLLRSVQVEYLFEFVRGIVVITDNVDLLTEVVIFLKNVEILTNECPFPISSIRSFGANLYFKDPKLDKEIEALVKQLKK